MEKVLKYSIRYGIGCGLSMPQFCLQKIYETMLHTHQASREPSLDRDNVEFRENKGLGIDLNVEFGLQTDASGPPRETVGDLSLNREAMEFREHKRLGIDLNVEFYPEAEASVVLRSTRAVDKVLSNDLELEVVGVLAVEKSSSAGDCDAKEVGVLLKKKKEAGDHSDTDSLTIESIGKESRSSKVSEAIYLEAKDVNDENKKKGKRKRNKKVLTLITGVKTALPFLEGEEKHKFSGLILLSEAAEMQELKPPSKAKESEAAVAAKGQRSIESSSSKRSSDSSGEDCLHGDLEDTSPVARSKRGRSQVLPSRYRDSIVLTPWKGVVRSQGAAAAPMLPKK
ncbi:hypothetical protein GH714_001279 [Hevea brasiliensis]|uniref:Uncharacterized protein n=1 Tax=Hevea brasiliensis TaxID=3981 RepID=A0A6A6K796_HEVBR|nr:hypothetical protein GH714_001279 [Hevea brasiliensis]